MEYLGFIIDQRGVHVDPAKVEKIQKFPRPVDVTGVKSFLGMVNFYRRFIRHCSKISKPLTELTKSKTKWEWSPKCEIAFTTLKDALSTPPVLATADPSKPYVIHCDASDHNIGAVLMQEHEDGLHPIAYSSHTLPDTLK